MSPLYDTRADEAANAEPPPALLAARTAPVGPGRATGGGTLPDAVLPGATVLGVRLRTAVGVAASPLTVNARWVGALSDAGFDVLTHKTVRSRAHPAHPFPQWLLDDRVGTLGPDRTPVVMHGGPSGPPAGVLSSANSFGVPSPEPAAWQADLQRCLEVLGPDRLLLASVMGSPEEFGGAELMADFVRVARLAAATGVRAVELNLSCPNTLHARGSGSPDTGGVRPPLCADPVAAAAVVGAVRAALPSGVAVVAKLSALPANTLGAVVRAIAPDVDGVAGINAVQRRVLSPTGVPAFPGRERAGVSGSAVRERGLDFVRRVVALRAAAGASFAVLGMGGVLTPADVVAFREAGADAVQSVTGTCGRPTLAAESPPLVAARATAGVR